MITNQQYIELFDAARDVVEQYYFDQIMGAIYKTLPEVMESKINKLTMILYSKKENDHV